MDTLIFAANSVLPIILVIVLGYNLKRIGFFDSAFLKTANKLVFKIGIPTYLFYSVYTIESFSMVNWRLIIYCVAVVLILYFAAMAVTLAFTKDNGKRGVLIQCAFRSNFAIIGLTLADAMGGSAAVAVAAILSAFSIPLFNILAVITLSVFGQSDSKASVKGILKSIAQNPLIIGVFSALVCLAVRHFEPTSSTGEPIFTIQNNLPFLFKAIKSVSSIASPLALIVLGGQFTFSAVRSLAREIVYGVAWRLVIAPLIGIGLITLLSAHTSLISVSANDYPALIALFGSPVAVASAIMAESMNCHGELARQLVVWTSLFSIVTVFLIIVIMRSLCLL
jgi:hypothetical protein